MIEIACVRDIDGFRNLKEEWNELLSKSSSSNLFLTWEWLFTWWEVYGDSKRLEILLGKKNGKVIGIAPLCSWKTKLFAIIPIRKIGFLGGGAVASDHLDLILEEGKEEVVIECFFDYLKSLTWDRIELNDFRDSSKNIDILKKKFSEAGIKVFEVDGHICPYINLPASWDEYLNSLTWRTRKHIRHDTRLLVEKMGAKFVEWNDEKTIDKPLSKLIELHQKRWTLQGKIGSFGTRKFHIFHHKLIQQAYDKGYVKIYLLDFKGEIISIFYCFKMNKTLYAYSTGFDEKYWIYGSGTVLLGKIIRDCIEKGMTEFDFLRGESDYKYKWTINRRINKDIIISRPTRKMSILIFREKLNHFFVSFAKQFVPRTIYLKAQKMRDFFKLR